VFVIKGSLLEEKVVYLVPTSIQDIGSGCSVLQCAAVCCSRVELLFQSTHSQRTLLRHTATYVCGVIHSHA